MSPKTTGLRKFAKKTPSKATPSKQGGAGTSLVARKSPAPEPVAHAPDAADVKLGPRGGKLGARPDRRIKLSVKVSESQYRALRIRAAEQSTNVQEILVAAVAKLFEDDGLSFG